MIEERTPTFVDHGLDRFATTVRRVDKPWGYELIYAVTEDYCGKVLVVKPGQSLSLQYHERKDETIYLDEGIAHMEIGDAGGELSRAVVTPGACYRIRPGTVHRMIAVTTCVFLEVSTPHLDDVVRLEDRYGRSGERAG
jgi:mannose-6-phosphate isomerase-like protein (cupin superfamily)